MKIVERETVPLFKSVLTEFDQKPFKPLLENEIYNLIQKQIPEGKTEFSLEEKAELIAFRYLETHKASKEDDLIPYFKPLSVTKNEDGSTTEFPSLQMVTPETIEYWIYRSENSTHPVLVARYSGLVYEFSPKIVGTNAHYLIGKRYIEALLDVISEKLYKVPIYAIGKVKRALEVSIYMNDRALSTRCKDSIIYLENEIAISDKPGLWGFSFDLLVTRNKKLLSSGEEETIVQGLEKRLKEMLSVDSWATECATQRLANYYHRQKQPDEVRRVLKDLELSYAQATSGLAIIQKAHYVEKLYHFYKQFQLNEEAESFLIKLRELSKETDKELKSISAAIDVPKEKLENYVDQILTGKNSEIIFVRIIEANTPRVDEIKQELETLSKSAPLQFLLSRDLLDKKGRRVAKIGPLSEDPESHLILQLSNSIRIGTIFLHFTFEEGEKRGIFTTHEILKFLKKSCIIEKDRFEIIEKGLNAYFVQDYVSSIHFLVPQFEEAIRNLVEMNGGSVMIQKADSFNLKTFDHLLNDEIIMEVFGEDMSLYFRTLFTDKRGWNLRNNVAHGMLDIIHFNKQNTDRLIHALLCLGMVRLKDV